MLTYIKKNLIIAALEDSLLTGKKAAGISTLAEMDMLLAALRSRLNANPDAVTDKSIWQMYARLNALKFPSVSNIWWAFNDLSMFDSVDTDTIGWSNVTGKPVTFPPKAHSHDYASITETPATFPPDVHAHDYASITDKPATFPPDVHAHDYASITNKPATFPPELHTHVKADVTDFPTAFPPELHTHVKADVTDFPTTMPPSAHSHAYADITSKPTTFAPSAHSHAVTTSMYYIGNGEGSRVLSLPIAIIPQIILICPLNGGVTWYWAISLGSSLGGKSTFIANAISVASGSVSLTTSNANTTGVGYTLIVWGNAS